jgi:hypothetical protein
MAVEWCISIPSQPRATAHCPERSAANGPERAVEPLPRLARPVSAVADLARLWNVPGMFRQPDSVRACDYYGMCRLFCAACDYYGMCPGRHALPRPPRRRGTTSRWLAGCALVEWSALNLRIPMFNELFFCCCRVYSRRGKNATQK